MKAKIVTKVIYECCECKYSKNGTTGGWFCLKEEKKEIISMRTIPDWCPLQDAEQDEVDEVWRKLY